MPNTARRAATITLSCAPTASGVHPATSAACGELRAADGNFDALPAGADVMCTRAYDPVVVTVDGVWQGRRVPYERTFSDECVKNPYGTSVFTF